MFHLLIVLGLKYRILSLSELFKFQFWLSFQDQNVLFSQNSSIILALSTEVDFKHLFVNHLRISYFLFRICSFDWSYNFMFRQFPWLILTTVCSTVGDLNYCWNIGLLSILSHDINLTCFIHMLLPTKILCLINFSPN